MKGWFLAVFFLQLLSTESMAQPAGSSIIPGAERTEVYVSLLQGKNVGIFANPTSTVGKMHLVDTLLKLGVHVTVIFGPEHGFRGNADAGEKVGNYIDEKTGIPVVSLYGAQKNPTAENLKNTDILVFDLQDVGTRFYTYINSMQEFLETAIEHQKPLLLLDRPNPNGFYVDGPVLDTKYKSGVGRQPIPIVYGMTMGEYARMLIGEKWLSKKATEIYEIISSGKGLAKAGFDFKVIPCSNYTHNSKYVLPVKPSPNLPDMQSIYLYPSTCLFEGTVLSEGRGTTKPFQVFGHPDLPEHLYSFTPNPTEGAKNSKHYGKICYGWNLSGTTEEVLQKVDNKIQLKWLLEAYRLFPKKDSFFLIPKSGNMEQSFMTKLSGTNDLWQQIKAGTNEEEIRKSWEPKLSEFKAIRKKYLLYEDFE